MNAPLEEVYRHHHSSSKRGDDFIILGEERGNFLRKHIGTRKSVVDIGCRDGELTSTYCNENDVLGVDIDSDALERAHIKLGIETLQADLNTPLNLPENQYDVAVACEILEHIYFPGKVMERISKHLKVGGILVGSIPHAFPIQSRIKYLLGRKDGTPLQDPTHITQFHYKEFQSMLNKYFDAVEVEYIVPKRYQIFSKINPGLFAHCILFKGVKK